MLANPLLVALLGVVAGVIPGVFGGGGGWLLVPLLVLLIGEAGWSYASGTVICAYLSGVVAGVVGAWLAEGHEPVVHAPGERRVAGAMTAGALVGTVVGKLVLRDCVERLPWATVALDLTLIVALAFIVWRMLYEALSGNFRHWVPRAPALRRLAAVTLLSLAPGVLAGLIGIGGGIFYVPILLVVLRWRPDEARHASRLCVLITSLVAAALYALSGGVHVPTAAGMLIPAGIVGVVLSAVRFSHSDHRQRLFRLLAAGLAALAIAVTVVNMARGGGSASPPGPGSPQALLAALYLPLSWGVVCAVGQHLLFRKLRPGEPVLVEGPWFYQI